MEVKGSGDAMEDAIPPLGRNSLAAKLDGPDGTASNSGPSVSAIEGSDEQLMTAFARGSTDAFTELFSRYKQPLFGFFWRRVGDRAQAEELTQETFIAVIRAASRYEPHARFRSYLYAIAFKILRAFRRKAAFRATFFGSPPDHFEPAQDSGLDTQLFMREALRKLNGMDREVLLLREFEQLSYTEIANLLQIPLNTVRSRLFRARTALRDLLAEQHPFLKGELRTQEENI
jgi:RNA polymerase sigma-70 factor, ECF subfamily